MLYLSELYIEFLAFYYNGRPYYHHINSKGMWEFFIIDDFNRTIYRSKGLR